MLNRRRMLMGGAALAGAASLPFAASVLAATAEGSAGVNEAMGDVVAWLKANALPLASAEPGTGFADLAPLRKVIGDARVVALGEATHGTREFFQLKHRMIEYCVSQLGFTVIGFEAEYGSTLAVNEYVLNGKGNAMDATTGMGFWTWDTEEVTTLVEWVRTWNLSHERKVKFYGFDMQGSASSALHLLAYLERVDRDLAVSSERALSPLVSYGTLNEFRSLPEDVRKATLDGITAVLDAFDEDRDEWIASTSRTDWHLARQSAVVMRQFARAQLLDVSDDEWTEEFTFRDRAMAANVRQLLNAEGRDSKAVLWAHNGHVQQSKDWDIPGAGRFEMANMGSFLKEEFDDDYVVVGFSFNRGSFKAMGMVDGAYKLGDHEVGAAPGMSVDATLAATGVPMLALDLTRVPDRGPVARWMRSKPTARMIGAVFAGDEAQYAMQADPRDQYDVLMFVENATASRGNKRPDTGTRSVGAANNEVPTNLALAADGAIPTGWLARHHSLYPFRMAAADDASPAGGRTMRIARSDSPLAWGDGEVTQTFPAAPWRGRRMAFGAAMRAEAPRIGTGAQIVVKVWPKGKEGVTPKPLVTMRSDGMIRSADWERRLIELDVPAEAERIQISLVVTGDSAGSFGDLEVVAAGEMPKVSLRPSSTRPSVSERPASIRPALFRGLGDRLERAL